MRKCPYCGNYMRSHLETTPSGGWMNVWDCICGYSTKWEQTWYSDRSTGNPKFHTTVSSLPYGFPPDDFSYNGTK